MESRELEMSDVAIVLDDTCGPIGELVERLKQAGLSVTSTDEDNGVVEGTIATQKVKSLESVQCVKYLRSVFNYVADLPDGEAHTGDASDREDDDLPE